MLLTDHGSMARELLSRGWALFSRPSRKGDRFRSQAQEEEPMTTRTNNPPFYPTGALSLIFHLVFDGNIQNRFRMEREKVMHEFRLSEGEQELFEYCGRRAGEGEDSNPIIMALLTMALDQVRDWKQQRVDALSTGSRHRGALSFMYHLVHDARIKQALGKSPAERKQLFVEFE